MKWNAAASILLSALPAVAQPDAVGGPVGKQFHLSPDKLPPVASAATLDTRNLSKLSTPHFVAPPGFQVSLFSAQAGAPRTLAVAPNGDVFAASSDYGNVIALRDPGGNQKATQVTTFASGYSEPHGLAFHDGALYIADQYGVWRQPYHDGDMVAGGARTKVTAAADLRLKGFHWTREIIFDPKGQLYLAIGARADIEDNDPPPDASVQLIGSDGSMTSFATGLRNVVGMAFRPGSDELWGTDNERDGLGPELPPDFLTSMHKGDFFGWPYAYIGPHADPMFGRERPDLVKATKTPSVLFEAHSAPLAVVFYDGMQFPSEYRGDAFVALHGAGPYDHPDGYKVVRVRFAKGKPVGGYEDFLTGWMLPATTPLQIYGTSAGLGMPAGLAVAKDGSLLIADELTIWRVSYTGKSK